MEKSLKQQVEQAIGDSFIAWYNSTVSNNFVLEGCGDDPPDLVYRDKESRLPVEVTTTYYDSKDAKIRWGHARHLPNAPASWSGANIDQTLVANIERQIETKCSGTHDAGTILIVGIYPAITSKVEFDALVEDIGMPETIPFAAIYVAGTFPSSRDGPEGYACWKLYPK